MRILFIVILIVSGFSIIAQEKKMKEMIGFVSDVVTFQPVQDVIVYTKDSAYICLTDEKGNFNMVVPRKTGRLNFYHPNYEFKSLPFPPLTTQLDIRIRPLPEYIPGGDSVFGSDGEKIEMKYVNGLVDSRQYQHNRHKRQLIPDVNIYTKDKSITTTSDSNGYYRILLPKKERNLIFEHPDYKNRTISLASISRRVNVSMTPLDTSGPATQRHAVGWLPTKLFWGMISLKYEFWVESKHSIGIYGDYYVFGWELFGSERFKGIKITPYYRYYFKRTAKRALYGQASAIVAYYDFEYLNYHYHYSYPYDIPVRYMFWTGGFGLAAGWNYILGEPRNNNIYVDINLGFQLLPAPWPKQLSDPLSRYKHNKTWWYLGGPGSVIELKLAIGGIF